MMRGRTLMRAVANGRGLFLAAGGILGVGIYGFVATFQPYASGRVLEPHRVVDGPLVATRPGFLEVLPAAVESSAAAESLIESAPQEPAASFGRTAPSSSPAPSSTPGSVEAAGGDGGVTPLAPPPAPSEKPTGIGPIIVDAPSLPTNDASRGEPPASDVPAAPVTPPKATPTVPPTATPTPHTPTDDDPGGTSRPAKPGKSDNGNGNGNGAAKSQGQGKANGQSK